MTNGLVKERMTYFHENGTAYQAYNTIMNTAKVMVYYKIDHIYTLGANFNVDHKITVEELELIAIEREALYELNN
ncbi:MAG: hypothetical protein IJ955_03090 [Oscillospiraceae bacterium]|nr:hypothetical protein [Oscillospiraceae bacterium]